MKKTLIFFLIITLLMSSLSFADKNQEERNKNNLLDTAEAVKQSVESLEIEESDNKPEIAEFAEELEDKIKMLEQSTPRVDIFNGKREIENDEMPNDASGETMFVTDIRGDFYKDKYDVPTTMRYSYYRPSDGAVFEGTLTWYYIRQGFIGPLPFELYFQAFYEGTLTFQFYAH